MTHTGRAVAATVAMEAAETTLMRQLAVMLVPVEEVLRVDMEEEEGCRVDRDGWVACLVDQE